MSQIFIISNGGETRDLQKEQEQKRNLTKQQTEDMWKMYMDYETVIDKFSYSWYSKLGGREDLDSIKNECVLGYFEVYYLYIIKQGRVLSRDEFSKLLWCSCYNRVMDVFIKKVDTVEIEENTSAANSNDFLDLYKKLWKEDSERLLSSDGKELLLVLLEKRNELENIHEQRIKVKQRKRYNTNISTEDIRIYFIRQQDWSIKRLEAAIEEVGKRIPEYLSYC